MKIKRNLYSYHDTRVHVCLYFIAPTGHTWVGSFVRYYHNSTVRHRLKSLDLVAMKKLESKVSIIPVIAKSDTITKTEMQKFKAKVCFDYWSVVGGDESPAIECAVFGMRVCVCVWLLLRLRVGVRAIDGCKISIISHDTICTLSTTHYRCRSLAEYFHCNLGVLLFILDCICLVFDCDLFYG